MFRTHFQCNPPLCLPLFHSCAKLVVADPASAIKTHLLEQMWRHGVHVAIDRLRRAGPAAATAAQRLQVLEPAKTDYRTLAKAIQDRLPSKLSPDLARVDVKDVRLKGTSHRANVREQHKDRLTCSFLLCYHHCHLALGDIARYMAEAQQALEASEHTLTGSASAESDALHRLDRLCRLHYEVRHQVLDAVRLFFSSLTLSPFVCMLSGRLQPASTLGRARCTTAWLT